MKPRRRKSPNDDYNKNLFSVVYRVGCSWWSITDVKTYKTKKTKKKQKRFFGSNFWFVDACRLDSRRQLLGCGARQNFRKRCEDRQPRKTQRTFSSRFGQQLSQRQSIGQRWWGRCRRYGRLDRRFPSSTLRPALNIRFVKFNTIQAKFQMTSGKRYHQIPSVDGFKVESIQNGKGTTAQRRSLVGRF